MDVVLLATDLTVVSRLQGAASRIGAMLHSAANVGAAQEICREQQAALLILDLAMPNVDLSFVPQLKAGNPQIHVIAFGPHVHKERLANAEAAGCDIVLSRGAFWSQAETLLIGAATGS